METCVAMARLDILKLSGTRTDLTSARFQEYQIIGRHLPTETNDAPKIYRMRIFASNPVVAKSRFWYFLGKLRKIKKANGEIVSVNEVCTSRAYQQSCAPAKWRCRFRLTCLDPRKTSPKGQELRHLDSVRLAIRHTQHVQGNTVKCPA